MDEYTIHTSVNAAYFFIYFQVLLLVHRRKVSSFCIVNYEKKTRGNLKSLIKPATDYEDSY